jgi:hypothetical protein
MKVLLLSPIVDAQQSGEKALKGAGHAVLVARDEGECEKLRQIHGHSVDLYVLFREGQNGAGTPGLKIYSNLKAKPETRDVPVVLVTSVWTEQQCQEHQADPYQGAHAYLKFPFDGEALIQTIQQIFGISGDSVGAPSLPPPVVVTEEGGVQLEDATSFATRPETDSQILLEPSGEATLERSPGIPAALSIGSPPDAVATPPPIGELGSPETGIDLGLETDAVQIAAPTPVEAPAPALVQTAGGVPKANTPEGELSIHIDPTRAASSNSAPEPAFQPAPPPAVEEPTGPNPYEQQFGYLLAGALKNRPGRPPGMPRTPPPAYALPEIPAAASSSADLTTLRQYLAMREQDVGVLSAQMKALREQVQIYESNLAEKESECTDLSKRVNDLESEKARFEMDKGLAVELEKKRGKDREFELQAKADRAQALQKMLEQAQREIELIRERVRTDLRKIRVRERELENRLELARKDAESLIAVRENRIIEVKRKLDITEFNFDLLQEKYEREKENAARLREKLDRASRAMRVAGGVLEDSPDTPTGDKAG